MMIFWIWIFTNGLSRLSVLTFSISQTVSKPLVTLPKIVCFLLSQGLGIVVIKNWLVLVLGPLLAIHTKNG
jgi:hypothetical protein